MKTNKLFLGAAILFAAVSLGASNLPLASGTKAATVKTEAAELRITADDIIAHLQGYPHYHAGACCAVPIPGTTNWLAEIGGGLTATVFVENGIIVGHADNG